MRSMMTSYPLGAAIWMPPILTNSAVTSGTFMELMYWTTADGNVFSLPNRMPIFFMMPSTVKILEILDGHTQPQRPIVNAVVAPDVQPVRNGLGVHNSRHLHVLVQAHVPVGCGENPSHALAILAQKPLIAHVRQVVRGVVEVAVVIVVAVQKLLDVIGPTHTDAVRDHVRMLERKIQCLVAPEAAPGYGKLSTFVLIADQRQNVVEDVALILHVSQDPPARMGALVVPAFEVHAIRAENLKLAAVDFVTEHTNHAPVGIFEKAAHGSREDDQGRTRVAELEHLHLAVQIFAVPAVIFTIHRVKMSNKASARHCLMFAKEWQIDLTSATKGQPRRNLARRVPNPHGKLAILSRDAKICPSFIPTHHGVPP